MIRSVTSVHGRRPDVLDGSGPAGNDVPVMWRGWTLVVAALAGPLSAATTAEADHTPDPTSVTVAGSLQSELGCPGDWQADCAATHLAYDAGDDVWQGSWTVPAGSYEYKAALNDGWDENYGLHASSNGDNIPLHLAAADHGQVLLRP